MQIFGPEHAREDQHARVCTSAPILDRRARMPLGVVTLSGAFRTAHPHTLMLVTMGAREAVDALAGEHERDLRRVVRASERVWAPSSLREGALWVPEIGQVRAKQISGGWVLHEEANARGQVDHLIEHAVVLTDGTDYALAETHHLI